MAVAEYWPRLGGALIAAWGALCASLVLFNLCLFYLGQQWLLYVVMIAAMGALITLSYYKQQEATILSTALVGSYMMMLSTNAFIGNFNNLYNPFLAAELKANGLLVTIDYWYMAFLGLFLVCFALGVIVQCIMYKKE